MIRRSQHANIHTRKDGGYRVKFSFEKRPYFDCTVATLDDAIAIRDGVLTRVAALLDELSAEAVKIRAERQAAIDAETAARRAEREETRRAARAEIQRAQAEISEARVRLAAARKTARKARPRASQTPLETLTTSSSSSSSSSSSAKRDERMKALRGVPPEQRTLDEQAVLDRDRAQRHARVERRAQEAKEREAAGPQAYAARSAKHAAECAALADRVVARLLDLDD